jgi:hypothetical protein
MYVPGWLLAPSTVELSYRANERTRLLLDMRDKFVKAYDKYMFELALDLATTLADEFDEARWLIRVFPTAPKNAKHAFIALDAIARYCSDHMAYFYLSLMSIDRDLLVKAASLGNEIAKIILLENPTIEQIMSVNDRTFAHIKFPDHPYAAYMGELHAMSRLSKKLNTYEALVWCARACNSRNLSDSPFSNMMKNADKHASLIIGFLLKTNNQLYGAHYNSFQILDEYIKIYETCVARIKAAVRTWTMIARRLGFYADIRTLISHLVWDRFIDFADEPIVEEKTKVKRIRTGMLAIPSMMRGHVL